MAAVLCVGLATLDVVQTVSEFPAPGQKVQSADVSFAPGGPAANAARAVAALGGSASLLTALGDDPLASVLLSALAPVTVHAVTGITPVSMVVVRSSDGERVVVSNNAGSVEAQAGNVDPLVERADVVLVDGHHPQLALAASLSAKRSGLPVVLDAGSWKPVLDHLLPLVDVAACSSGFQPTDQELHARGVPLVIRTHGPEPVTWSRSGATGLVPVPSVEVRDTNGAGDVWHGAYALALAGGADPIEAIGHASAAAAVRVRNTVVDWVRELARWQDSRSGSTSC